MSPPDCLFVYGTLRRGHAAPQQQWLARSAQWLGEGSIAGRLYDVGDYPACVARGDGPVRGDLYRVPAGGDLLARLDEYEECSPAFPPPHEYVRRVVAVTRDDGSDVMAWVYLYARDVSGLVPVPSGDYLAWLRRDRRNTD